MAADEKKEVTPWRDIAGYMHDVIRSQFRLIARLQEVLETQDIERVLGPVATEGVDRTVVVNYNIKTTPPKEGPPKGEDVTNTVWGKVEPPKKPPDADTEVPF